MLPDNVMNLLWMLVFFIIFYIYIDVKISRLRTELLSHYMMCEKLITDPNSSRMSSSQDLRTLMPNSRVTTDENITIINAPAEDLVPTREEMQMGLADLNKSMRDIVPEEMWKDGTSRGAFSSNDLKGFDVGGDYDNYAPLPEMFFPN